MVSIEERREMRRQKILAGADVRLKKIIYTDVDGRITADDQKSSTNASALRRKNVPVELDGLVPASNAKKTALNASYTKIQRCRHFSSFLAGVLCRLFISHWFMLNFTVVFAIHESIWSACDVMFGRDEATTEMLITILTLVVKSDRLAKTFLQLINMSILISKNFVIMLAAFFITHIASIWLDF